MNENKEYYILIGIAVLAFVIIATFIFFIPVKESFTELYFDNFKYLPKTIELGKDYSFSFTIHNKEGKSMNYVTNINLELDGNIQTLSSQSIFLVDESIQSISYTFNISQNFTKGKIIVQIPNREIHFWVNQK